MQSKDGSRVSVVTGNHQDIEDYWLSKSGRGPLDVYYPGQEVVSCFFMHSLFYCATEFCLFLGFNSIKEVSSKLISVTKFFKHSIYKLHLLLMFIILNYTKKSTLTSFKQHKVFNLQRIFKLKQFKFLQDYQDCLHSFKSNYCYYIL